MYPETFDSTGKESMVTKLAKLTDAIMESWTNCLNPPYGSGKFTPEDGQTDCNGFVNMVAEKMGYKEFKPEGRKWPMIANEICDKMKIDSKWRKTNGNSAQFYANHGYLVIAGWRNPNYEKSGHVAIVRPGILTTSRKWSIRIPGVPKVANVGKAESCRLDLGANWAFGEIPDFFVLKEKL